MHQAGVDAIKQSIAQLSAIHAEGREANTANDDSEVSREVRGGLLRPVRGDTNWASNAMRSMYAVQRGIARDISPEEIRGRWPAVLLELSLKAMRKGRPISQQANDHAPFPSFCSDCRLLIKSNPITILDFGPRCAAKREAFRLRKWSIGRHCRGRRLRRSGKIRTD